MSYTPAERAAAQTSMFGCTSADIDNAVASAISGPRMMAMSLLSDAQELQAMQTPASLESARQFINKAKYIITEHLQEL
jgi:hypothetical protein|tara:strand:+ start:2207 stop:2443 length:237 start_codon:yes stop_codon:yes gene_type:complete